MDMRRKGVTARCYPSVRDAEAPQQQHRRRRLQAEESRAAKVGCGISKKLRAFCYRNVVATARRAIG